MFDMVELEAVEARLRALAASFDSDALPTAQAALVVKKAATIENIAATLKALAANRAAQAGGFRRRGHRSAAEQLAQQTGTTVGDAISTLTRGENLDNQPAVAAAALDGRLSPAQAGVIADAANTNPAAAPKLLDTAAAGGSLVELKQQCGEAKADVVDREERRRQIHRRRRLRWWTDPEGEAHISGNGNPEDIAQVASFLQPLADAQFDQARREGRREHPDAYRFDALINYCTTANSTPTTANGEVPDPEGDATVADVRPAGDATTPNGGGTTVPGASTTVPDVDRGGGATALEGASTAPRPVPGDTPGRPDQTADPEPSGRACPTGSVGTPDSASPPPAGAPVAATLDLGLHADDHPATGQDHRIDPAGPTGPPTGPGRPPPVAGRSPTPPVAGRGRRGAKRGPARPRPRTGAPTKLIIRVDLDAFLRGSTLPGDICDLVGYGPIAVTALHDLIKHSDPFVAAVFTKAKRVIGVAHLGRQPTAYQKTVLEWLYPTCAAQGCPATARLEKDHRIDWADTHITLTDWLDALCHHHHALKTRFGWALVNGTGKRPFVPPDDPRHPKHHQPEHAAGGR
ncbi:MAG: hypothetical protein ACRDZ8_11745 [Acidimicrobiales bacterium]